MIWFLVALVSGTSVSARTLELHGRNANFGVRVTLTDVSGRGLFGARHLRLDDFAFEYVPITAPRSPRELHLVDIFGRRRFELSLEDVEPEISGSGLAVKGDGATGYYLRFRLKPRARQIISRYRYVGVGLGPFGSPRSPHHVVVLNDDDDYEDGTFRWSTWHRLDVGRMIFLESLLTCENHLSAPAP